MDWFVNYIIENKYQIALFMIAYLPTILFCFTLLSSILLSALRGLRKTYVFLLHTLIAFTICLILFIALVEIKEVDMFVLKIMNSILGDGAMQRIFGVSTSCESFREIFIEYIPKQLTFMDGLALLAKENGKYLSSLVDVAYRFTFGIVLYVLFWILKLLMWIIYLIFFNERKYVKKREKQYENGLIDSPYRKKRLMSAGIGLAKGLISASVMISFIGMFFYIIAGGIGDKKREKIEFEDQNINFAYDAYSEIESYGTNGIFKILNVLRDEKDMPYYLFAANMIFQGRVSDPIDTRNVYLIDELATYVDFSRDTFDLFLKYDKDNIVAMVNNQIPINIMDEVLKVFKNEEFQKEFSELIANFESKTYFINLTLSLIDSLSNHLTEIAFTSGLSEDVLIPLRIMFEKGYLCDQIPYESSLKNKKEASKDSKDYNENDYLLDYINPSKLITREDVSTILKLLINVLETKDNLNTDNRLAMILDVLKGSIGYIKDLSILETDGDNELDGVFKRLFAYLEIKYLDGISDKVITNNEIETEGKYISGAYDSIKWVEELTLLLDVLDEGMSIYDEVYEEGIEPIDLIYKFFDSKYSNRVDKLLSSISSSRLIGELFNTNLIVDIFDQYLNNMLSDVSFPDSITFGNKYDSEGHFEDYGELYHLTKCLKFISSNESFKELVHGLTSGEGIEVKDLINDLVNIVSQKQDNELGADILVDSRIMTTILSSFLIGKGQISGDFEIYIDDSIREVGSDGSLLNIIQQDELRLVLYKLPKFIELAQPIIDGEEVSDDFYLEFIDNEEVQEMFDSKIIEGTASLLIANSSTTEGTLICPMSMKNGEGLVTIGSHTSELKKLLEVKRELDIDLKSLLSEEEGADNKIIDIFTSLTSKDIDLLLSSNILYYSISKYMNNDVSQLFGDFNLIIPDEANNTLENDTLDVIIKKEILRELINAIRILAIKDEIEIMDLLGQVIRNNEVMDNFIISASVANAIANDPSEPMVKLREKLSIPVKYSDDNYGDTEKIRKYYGISNPWYQESRALIRALNLMLNLGDDEGVNPEEIIEKIVKNVDTLNDNVGSIGETKLDKVYESEILVSTISREIDERLTDEIIDTNILPGAKVFGTDDYKKLEVRGIVSTLKELDIRFEDITGGFTEEKFKSKYDNDSIYESRIIRGIISKRIYDNLETAGELVINNDLCCEDGLQLFRQSELKTLFRISLNVASVSEFIR